MGCNLSIVRLVVWSWFGLDFWCGVFLFVWGFGWGFFLGGGGCLFVLRKTK